MMRSLLVSIAGIVAASLAGWLIRLPEMQPAAPPSSGAARQAPGAIASVSVSVSVSDPPGPAPADRPDTAAAHATIRTDVEPVQRGR